MGNSSEYKSYPLADSNEQWTNLTQGGFYYPAKRMIDLLASVVLLICFAPIMFVVAILIKLDSPGPVFFKQTRVGACRFREGKSFGWKRVDFPCYKFRTMADNTSDEVHKAYIKALVSNDERTMREMEGDGTSVHKLVYDKRITRVGKYLRKSSLDELPQFFNVIRGEMSLVGPRPAIPYEIEMYSERHLGRLNAKPGISGLQQVTARNTASFEEQIDLDLEYIKKQSIWLDFQIIIKTPFAIFSQKGA
jgi:lipopolysaccharide/colanic/teichoic acid biosynthesis glycosyltransferase